MKGTVHAYLTRKAQARLDSTAVVYVDHRGRWIVERKNEATYDLGENFGRAKEALYLLINAAKHGAVARNDQ